MYRNSHRIVQLTMAEMISAITNRMGREIIPLSPHKRVYIEAGELIKKHDERVALELADWEHKNLQ